MRLLPDKPSLDFLRKEAKDLLAALRETDPATSLATAQRALAEQYGMRDWNELKDESVRRAAAPIEAPDGLAEALAEAFGLGVVAEPAAPVSYTPMGRSWSIRTDRGRWLAGTVYPWITEDQAELGARLRDAAVAAGIAAPVPRRGPTGRLIATVGEQSWRVHEWIEVGPTPVSPTPSEVAHGIGSIHATLHGLAIPGETEMNPYLTWRRSAADWEQLVDRAAAKPWVGKLRAALPALSELGRIDSVVDGNDLVLCNCNVIPENVRTGHDGRLVVTEWDFAGSLTPELELASALWHWSLRPRLNRAAAKAFRDGYAGAAGRWPKLGLDAFAVAVTAYLNWTHNTICEAIDPPDEDRAAFAEREANDLLDHPITVSALQELLVLLDD